MSSTITEVEKEPIATDYLRSVNVAYDIDAPERISHFRPTSKSVPLLKTLAFDPASENFLVVAPYGSGKSLLATYVGHVIENRSDGNATLREIAKRVERLNKELGVKLNERLDEAHLVRPSGLALVLHGYQENLAKALVTALRLALERVQVSVPIPFSSDVGQEDLPEVLSWLADAKSTIISAGARSNVELQRIVILWDEFGRHLEELVADGDAAKLNDVQLLAEFAARQRAIPVCMALFLHQSLANYAAGLSQTVRKEWKKVEGRFETVQFVDDSAEMTALIAEIVSTMRPGNASAGMIDEKYLQAIERAGLFKDVSASQLPAILEKAYPLEPATLYLLPRVSARVAQNERTLFSFLFASDLSRAVSPTDLFDYFAESMRGDTGIGGAYHQWLETQNAIEQTTDHTAVDVLKTSSLLGLGVSGHRSRVAKELLELSAAGYRLSFAEAQKAVDALISQKLLLYRKSTDQVSVWHGVDIDLRGRLEREKARIGLSFDVVSFIDEELPAQPWLPLEYNADFAITRYFTARYVRTSELDAAIEEAMLALDDESDGVVLHLVPDDEEDLEAVRIRLADANLPARLVVSVPARSVPIYDSALEVNTLRRMQEDDALTGEDPLVLPELRQMTDDSLEYLRRSLMRVTEPYPEGPYWIVSGSTRRFQSATELRHVLSEITRDEFPSTPRINNELIVRKRPRQVIVNARKKLLAGILEHYSDEDFQLEGYRPDRSMLNTVLLHTGLYVGDNGRWRFVEPEEVADTRLSTVWRMFKEMLTVPERAPKDLSAFFRELRKPPIGLRQGLYPILFAAALRAFPAAISLTREGEYVEDILPSTIESICSTPDQFELRVLPMTDEVQTFLSRLRACFDGGERVTSETDYVRATYDSVQAWLANLPPAARSTKRVSKSASRLRALLSRVTDPVELFLKRIPTEFQIRDLSDEAALKPVRRAAKELEGVIEVYYGVAEAAFKEALQLRGEAEITTDVKQWIRLIPEAAVSEMSNALAKAVLTRLKMPYAEPHMLIDSIASLLVDKTVNRWDDSTLAAFDIALRSAISQIEEYALQTAKDRPELAQELAQLAEVRIKNLYRYLKEIVGGDEASSRLREISDQQEKAV